MGRRYAGWFLRNAEHAQRVFEAIKKSPLPAAPKSSTANVSGAPNSAATVGTEGAAKGQKVAWGTAKVVG